MQENPEEAIKIPMSSLVPKMTLAANVYAMSGTMLLASGSELTGKRISRLRSIARVDPLAGDIYVHRRRSKKNGTTNGICAKA